MFVVGRLWILLVFASLGVLLAACAKKELVRDEAAKMIATADGMSTYRKWVFLQKDALQTGELLGYWSTQRGGGINISPSIRDTILSVDWIPNVHFVKLTSERRLDVTVTGIEAAPDKGVARVEFRWRYADAPEKIRPLAVDGGVGVAAFGLYDDGWRLKDIVSITETDAPLILTKNEEDAFRREMQAAKEQREAKAKAVAEETEARRLRKQQALTEGASPKAFQFTLSWDRGRDHKLYRVAVTDSSLVVMPLPRYDSTKAAHIWFGAISDISVFPMTGANSDRVEILPVLKCKVNFQWEFFMPRDKVDEFLEAYRAAISRWQAQYKDLIPTCGRDEVYLG